MSTNFPAGLDSITNPSATDDTSTVSHADQHANANDAIEALEAKVGVNSSAVTSSLDYKVSNAASVDPGHKHSVDGLSATGTKDATTFLRGDNTFAEPPTTSDASVTAKGVAEEATEAEIDADTAAGAQARLFVNPSTLATSKYGTNLPSDDEKAALAGTGTPNGTTGLYVTNDDVSAAAAADKIVRATGTALPALSGANLTNLPALTSYYAGTDSVSSGVGNVTNTKTIGFHPKIIHYTITAADGNESSIATGIWTDTPSYQTIQSEGGLRTVQTSNAHTNTFTDGAMTITFGNVTSTGFDITYQRAGATWNSEATVSFVAIG